MFWEAVCLVLCFLLIVHDFPVLFRFLLLFLLFFNRGSVKKPTINKHSFELTLWGLEQRHSSPQILKQKMIVSFLS